MLNSPLSRDVARIIQAERLSAAERHHRLFRTPIAAGQRPDAMVITLPGVSPTAAARSAHVA